MVLGEPQDIGWRWTVSEPSPQDPGTGGQVFDIYRLAVEMADRVSARRASANSFFFTVQAGLAVALGAFAINSNGDEGTAPDQFVLTLAAIAGVVIAAAWWLLLRSYRDLNDAKFAVIGQIESTQLAIEAFNDEWNYLKGLRPQRWRLGYSEQGRIERCVPLVFLVLYLILSLYIAFS